MNNKHQELIAEKVEDLISQGFCFQHEIITETGSYPKTKEALNKTLQDTIDTVLKEERERTLEILTTTINANQMLRGWERYWKEVEPNRFVENCIECENTSRILKALDKTPPNKV